MRYIIVLLLISFIELSANDYFSMKKSVMKAYKNDNKTKAYDLTKKFIKSHPKDEKAKNLLAVLYYWDKKYKKSEEILSKLKYSEAKKLLKKVRKKLAKNSKKTIKSTHTQDIKYSKLKKKTEYEDLDYLISYVQNNPNDLQSRLILAKYYYKTEDYKKAYRYAKEALSINANQNDMKKIIKHIQKNRLLSKSDLNRDVDIKKAKLILNQYFKNKNYSAYFNLFQILENNNTIFSKQDYANALYASIMVGEYKEAQKIATSNKLPKSKYILELQMLLSKKLSKEVASK